MTDSKITSLVGGVEPPKKDFDFTNFKFSCHYLKNLVGASYNHYKKNNVLSLSQGAKSLLKQIYEEKTTGIKKQIKTNSVIRGITQENDSIKMINKFYKLNLSKNSQRFNDDFLTGEPDLIFQNSVMDVKTAENEKTFENKTLEIAKRDYFWQLYAYKRLTKQKKTFIIYCLPDYPQAFLESVENPEDFIYSHLPLKKRIKTFEIIIEDIDDLIVNNILKLSKNFLINLNN